MTKRATALLEDVHAELADVERAIIDHPFPETVARGTADIDILRVLACEQHWIITSDRRSFAYLGSRYAHTQAGALFLGLAEGEGLALRHLKALADWLDLHPDRFADHEPMPQAHAYTAYVSWLAMNASATDVAIAFLANLEAWGANCAKIADGLRAHHDADDDAVGFFTFFSSPPPGFRDEALRVVEDGLRTGDPPLRARSAARLLQAYELMFWDAMELAAVD